MTGFYGRDHVLLSEVLNEMGVTRFKNGDYISAKESFTEVSFFIFSLIYLHFFITTPRFLLIVPYYFLGITIDASHQK